MSSQMNLKGVAVSNVKADAKLNKDQKDSYNRFFVNAFTELEVDEIVEAGGNETKDNFEKISKEKMSKGDYWEKMFSKSFTGRDDRVRKSRFQELGKSIYTNYFKDLKPKAEIRTYKRNDKEYRVGVVPKGKTFSIHGKQFKGGRFLPRDYWGGA